MPCEPLRQRRELGLVEAGKTGERRFQPRRREVEPLSLRPKQRVRTGQGARGRAQRRAPLLEAVAHAAALAARRARRRRAGVRPRPAPPSRRRRSASARAGRPRSRSAWCRSRARRPRSSGMALAAAARTTVSSLKPHRSSSEPPPRATISTSGRGIGPSGGSALKPRIAAATSRRGGLALHPHRPDDRRGAGSGRRGGAGCRG